MEEGFGTVGLGKTDVPGGGVSHGGGRVGGVGKHGRSGKGGVASGTGTGTGIGRSKGKLGPPVEKAWAEKWRVELKIAGVRPDLCQYGFSIHISFFLSPFAPRYNSVSSTAW